MLVTKIDDAIDKTFDDFFNFLIGKKIIEKIKKNGKYLKNQKEIEKDLKSYFDSQNSKNIAISDKFDVSTTPENEIILQNIRKSYILYYFFLTIGCYHSGNKKEYIDGLIGFGNNLTDKSLQTEKYFNSESNSFTIKLSKWIDDILIIIKMSIPELKIFSKDASKRELLGFMNDIGDDFIQKNFMTDNKEIKYHNIIKTLIIGQIYLKNDKNRIFELIETNKNNVREYTFIDIIVPKTKVINLFTIKKLFGDDNQIAKDIYDLIREFDRGFSLSHNKKLEELLRSKMIIPIVEDFLLFHKDSEKYDMHLSRKDKHDMKVKYVISHINNYINYCSVVDKKPEFNNLLDHRNGVIINYSENAKIISNYKKLSADKIENKDLYDELMLRHKSSYVNFESFCNDGFYVVLNDGIEVSRKVSFDEKNKTNVIETRGAKGRINIVGFVYQREKSINGIRKNKIKNVNSFDKNGYLGMKNSILEEITGKIEKIGGSNQGLYWIFDEKNDKLDKDIYGNTKSFRSKGTYFKILVGELYNSIVDGLTENIIKRANSAKQQFTLNEYTELVSECEKNYIRIPRKSQNYDKLINNFYNNAYIKKAKKYDLKEDELLGVGKNVIELPKLKIEQNSKKVLTIDIQDIRVIKESKKESSEYICQHYILWEKIERLRKNNPGTYDKLLFSFMEKYLELDGYDSICRSCGGLLNIQRFVEEGSYDEGGNFVTFGRVFFVPLYESKKYSHHKSVIINLEKIINRISVITNLGRLSTRTSSSLVQSIIKNTIDLTFHHRKNLINIYKKRFETIYQKYSIEQSSTNFFPIFTLSSNMYIFSTKDKDTYKYMKKNNILIYILIQILINIDENGILFLITNKLCNYHLFHKYGINYFDKLKIIVNNAGDTDYIKNYKILCYLIYYFSCTFLKFGLWSFPIGNKESLKKIFASTQKVIIHTFVDSLNSIFEIYSKKNRNEIYDIFSVNFFNKMDVFKNKLLMEKLREMSSKQIDKSGDKIKFKRFSPQKIPVGSSSEDYHRIFLQNFCENRKIRIEKIQRKTPLPTNININTNCPDGKFHNWIVSNKHFKCELCGKFSDKLEKNKSASGIISNYVKNLKPIKKVDIDDSTDKTPNNNDYDSKDNFAKQIKRIKNEYGNDKKFKGDYYQFINKFLDRLKGSANNVISSKKINLFNDVYIIKHDHQGYPLKQIAIIPDTKDKIIFHKNHKFFKKDVIMLKNPSIRNVEIYYDPYNYILLGYKEGNKEFNVSKRTVTLEKQYSLKNKIKYLGVENKYIDLGKEIRDESLIYDGKIDNKQILKNIINKLSTSRISNLKTIVKDTVIKMYKLKYGEFTSKPFQKYTKNKQNREMINVKNIFENWHTLTDNMVYKEISDINSKITELENYGHSDNGDNKKNIIDYGEIQNYDYSGNLLLFYFLEQLSKLLDSTKNDFVRRNIADFIIEIIKNEFEKYDEDLSDFQMQKFKYLLGSKLFVYDYEEIITEENIVEEFEQINDEILDNDELNEGIDIDNPEDLNYDNVDYNPASMT